MNYLLVKIRHFPSSFSFLLVNFFISLSFIWSFFHFVDQTVLLLIWLEKAVNENYHKVLFSFLCNQYAISVILSLYGRVATIWIFNAIRVWVFTITSSTNYFFYDSQFVKLLSKSNLHVDKRPNIPISSIFCLFVLNVTALNAIVHHDWK